MHPPTIHTSRKKIRNKTLNDKTFVILCVTILKKISTVNILFLIQKKKPQKTNFTFLSQYLSVSVTNSFQGIM